jgi:hypothetical protein
MEFIRENKTYKDLEKAMVNASGVMGPIMRGNGRMDREMVLECFSKDKESNIKGSGKMIKSTVGVLLSSKMEM